MKSIFLLFSCCQVCFGASLLKGNSCNYFCAALLAPVCGTDGRTYGNECELNLEKCHGANIAVKHTGVCAGYVGPYSSGKRSSPCPPKPCILIYAPVCGSDGMTYGNSCELSANNCTGHIVNLARQGRC